MSRWREQRFGLLVTGATLVIFVAFYTSLRWGGPGGSDGHYLWLWARSAAFDGDWSFANDYTLCGDPFGVGAHAAGQQAPNPYYVGPSLLWTPVLLVLRVLWHFPAGASPQVVAGCTGPLVATTLLVGPVAGAVTTYLSYRAARRVASDGIAALAAALLCLGGLLPPFAASVPSASHVYAALSLALVVVASARALERPELTARWVWCAGAVAFCVLQRPPGLVYAAVPAGALIAARLGRRTVPMAAVLALGAVAGTLPLLAIYKSMYGGYFTSPVSGDYLHLREPHPFLLLFAPHGGLFYTTPIVWLSVLGLPLALRSRPARPWLLPLILAGSVEGYIYASGLDWHGSGTFGARRLTTLTPLFVVLAAFALARAVEWLRGAPNRVWVALGCALAAPVVFMNLAIVTGYARNEIDCCRGSSQADLYGQGMKSLWSLADSTVGDVAVLPAAWWLAVQHGIPVRRFRDATESNFYARDFRSRKFGPHDLPFGDARLVTVGFEEAPGGRRMTGDVGRVVFAAEWPRATALVITARSTGPVELAVGRRGAIGSVAAWGTVPLPGGDAWVEHRLALPEHAFSSGIVDLVLRQAQATRTDLWLRNIRIEDASP